jgi:hypothetical protein
MYYMGFLFTLTSLAVSLYQFSTAGSAAQIVQNFGIAIASTIAGIALRIFFNQMRRDPIEVEHTARLELAQASRKVKREMESSILEFSHFRRAAQQSIQDALDEMNAMLAEAKTKFVDQLEEFATTSSKPIEEASKRSADAIERLNARVSSATEALTAEIAADGSQLSKSTAAVVEAIDGVVTKLTSLQTPEKIIEIKLNPMIQGLSHRRIGCCPTGSRWASPRGRPRSATQHLVPHQGEERSPAGVGQGDNGPPNHGAMPAPNQQPRDEHHRRWPRAAGSWAGFRRVSGVRYRSKSRRRWLRSSATAIDPGRAKSWMLFRKVEKEHRFQKSTAWRFGFEVRPCLKARYSLSASLTMPCWRSRTSWCHLPGDVKAIPISVAQTGVVAGCGPLPRWRSPELVYEGPQPKRPLRLGQRHSRRWL